MSSLLISKYKSKKINMKSVARSVLFISLMFTCMHVFAEDLLKGTETNLIDMINGTGKKYLYIAEFVVACLAWVSQRTVKAFFGVIILAVGANIILKIGGII
ncbi:MAG: hypothetical protein KIT56_10340 [Gammaproteobacteria bacterium]|nr:hypothetical protein [Gammaproteobacteria bacterium]MCW5584248.1 hypothetical protein [Gammaproteobacteria bacterium]